MKRSVPNRSCLHGKMNFALNVLEAAYPEPVEIATDDKGMRPRVAENLHRDKMLFYMRSTTRGWFKSQIPTPFARLSHLGVFSEYVLAPTSDPYVKELSFIFEGRTYPSRSDWSHK